MQWLRHTRFEPPTVAEQHQDLMRQERMKMLAAQADARWAEKPSALDAPDKQQPVQPLQSKDAESGVTQMNVDEGIRDRAESPRQIAQEQPEPATDLTNPEAKDDGPATKAKKRMRKEPKDSPWKHAAQGQEWQPQGWSPAPAKRRS